MQPGFKSASSSSGSLETLPSQSGRDAAAALADTIAFASRAASTSRGSPAWAAGGGVAPMPPMAPPPALVAIAQEQATHPDGNSAPTALLRMLQMPGGSRALASAARGLLANNPLLRLPNAPCNDLLAQLSNLEYGASPAAAAATAAAAARAAAPAASLAGYRQQLAADGVKRHLTSVRIKRDESVEALEVLSSQFFSRAR